MKANSSWGRRPYALLNAPASHTSLFVNRICPAKNGFSVFYSNQGQGTCELHYKEVSEPIWHTAPTMNGYAAIEGLETGKEYSVLIQRKEDLAQSPERLVQTGEVLGVPVNYLHPRDENYAFSGRYLCSPSLLVLPGGKLLASMDVYGPQQAQNLSILFTSENGGRDWRYLTELYPCFWGKLFMHRNRVYMLAHSCEYGDLMIGYSADEGRTWSAPVRLFTGSNAREIGPHKAPMPILHSNGRMFTAIDYGSWKYGGHDSMMLSADENTDLMIPENWHLTKPLAFDKSWKGLPTGVVNGCLEGNAVMSPEGEILNILRLEQWRAHPPSGKAVILRYLHQDEALRFDRLIDFPLGSNSKFVILQENEWYLAIGNECFDPSRPRARSVLSLAISKDLVNWSIAKRVVDASNEPWEMIAFQYPDAQIDQDDLLILSRTSMNGAQSFHNSNLITFHRLENFRQYLF